MDKYLQPTSYLDFDYPDIKVFVQETIREFSDPRKRVMQVEKQKSQ